MHHVIIGNSAAGIACAEAIRSKDKKSKITIISEEDYSIYSRCLLSYFLAGDIKEKDLVYRPDDFYKTNKIDALIGHRCEKVLPEERLVKIKGKESIKFDQLLIAAGASPKFPDIKGAKTRGVFGLRTIKDAREMLNALKDAKTIAILGGGLIGLKAAYGLSAHKKDIRVIVKSKQVLSQILDEKSASIFQDWIEKRGVRVMTAVEATEILGGEGVKGITLDNGETLDCEMVVIGKGVQPNLDVVEGSGIKTDDGILVDGFLRTNFDYIYAAGDVAQAKDAITGEMKVNALWPVAVEEGAMAGLNMVGENSAYGGSIGMNSVEFFGLSVISMGITRSKEGFEMLTYEDRQNNIYKKVVLKDNTPVGMIFVNDIKSAGVVGAMIKNKLDISGIKEIILDKNFDFAKIADIVKDKADKFKQDEFKDIIITY